MLAVLTQTFIILHSEKIKYNNSEVIQRYQSFGEVVFFPLTSPLNCLDHEMSNCRYSIFFPVFKLGLRAHSIHRVISKMKSVTVKQLQNRKHSTLESMVEHSGFRILCKTSWYLDSERKGYSNPEFLQCPPFRVAICVPDSTVSGMCGPKF